MSTPSERRFAKHALAVKTVWLSTRRTVEDEQEWALVGMLHDFCQRRSCDRLVPESASEIKAVLQSIS